MRLSHNLSSLNIYREHTKVLSRQSGSLERISSGYKINSAKDNPNAIASSEKMRIQIRGLQVAQRNAQDGVSMLQTVDGNLERANEMLQRIRELSIQAGGGTTSEDIDTIKLEINQLIEGVDNIAKTCDFNGVKFLNVDPIKKLSMPVGANVGENVEIPTYNLQSSKLGDGTDTLDTIKAMNGNSFDINKAISILDGAIDSVIQARSKYGALSNRFESTYEKVGAIHDTIVGAESKIRDADIAEEMMNYTRDNVLIDSGHAMMVQSNKMPQEILRILENVRSR
jgi:flagellin